MRVHLALMPTEVINKLSKRFVLYGQSGNFGYFTHFLKDEFWDIVRELVEDDYRIDIKPGGPNKDLQLMVRKEQ